MPDLTLPFRFARMIGTARLIALLALAGAGASPAAAEAVPAPTMADPTVLSVPAIGGPPARYLQNPDDIDEEILLPAARDDDRPSARKWSRNYISVAAGVLGTPDYNGSDDRRLLPAFYVRGRYDGYSFSIRGTNLQVDLIRQRRGQKTDFKLGPIIGLRTDRTGSVKDPQVTALGKRKLAVEAGLFGGVTHTGVVTSDYDQIGFRLTALKDVSGRHGSWVVSPTIDYGTPLSPRAYVGVSASMNIYGKGFGRYYFDVDPAGSVASGLPVYGAAGRKATVGKYSVGVAAAHALSGDLRRGFVLIGGAQYARVTGRYGDSPIVAIAGDRNQWLFGGGIAYQF